MITIRNTNEAKMNENLSQWLERAAFWRDRDRKAMRAQSLMWRWLSEPHNRNHLDRLMGTEVTNA
jgi:hypothetical protein